MITVKLLGGAKKSFLTDKIKLEQNELTIKDLLDYLLKNKPQKTIDLDTKNLLVAVNGVDSSALEGFSTVIRSGDVVSLIPVIHGGSGRINFVVDGSMIELFSLKKTRSNVNLFDTARKEFPSLVIQGISSNFILNKNHAKKIITLSIYAKKNSLLSKKLETDILMRFAGTNQINQAIKMLGIKENQNFVIIAIGSKSKLDKLHSYLKPFLTRFKPSSHSFIKKQFGISQKQLNCVTSKTPLEDLLAEKAAILF